MGNPCQLGLGRLFCGTDGLFVDGLSGLGQIGFGCLLLLHSVVVLGHGKDLRGFGDVVSVALG